VRGSESFEKREQLEPPHVGLLLFSNGLLEVLVRSSQKGGFLVCLHRHQATVLASVILNLQGT